MAIENKNFNNIGIGEDILSMENITKIYGNGFVANKNVNFTVRKGEIHGLVGENGAGKTTLMKVLFGQEIPEEGRILLAGEEVKISSPLAALDYGIGMVHQHFMLVESLSVAENMVLGSEPTKGIAFDYDEAVRRATEVSKKFDLEVNPKALIRDLSVGYKQRVEILKMLLHGAQILLLDEPTAVLTPQETKELFVQLKQLREKGFSIVFISHKLNEVKDICDRITVLRNGVSVTTADVASVSEQDISRMMVGRDVILDIEKEKANPGKTVLSVSNLSFKNKFGLYAFEDLNFDIRSGEILGVAGVEGNGQSELSNVLAGLYPIQEGDIKVNGTSINGKSVREIREDGVAVIHEDRMTYGASTTQSIAENIISDRFYKPEYKKNGFIDWKLVVDKSKELIKSFGIKADGHDAEVRTLSGGNIQKVVAAREFTSNPKVLIASQPTRGIDVGAAELIRRKMIHLRDKEDTATLLFSADLTELLSLSDGIIVMYDGKITAYFPDVSQINEEILGEYMLGLKTQSSEEIGGVVHG
ncbi:MAG: ABC transporter ATP-binding protein [Tissierellaceae bacterium]|nr:ABC transporter ATP-binding protein [Tissierellaceae bacterium]